MSMTMLDQGRVVGNAEWGAMPVPDVYFSLGHHLASGVLEPDFKDVALVEWSDPHGVIRLPLILRSIPGTEYLDSTSAYEYGGPWVEGNPDVRGFTEYLSTWARQNSIVCTFLKCHPVVKNVELAEALVAARKVGITFSWDLAANRDLIGGLSKAHKRKFNKAIREGVEARITVNPSDLNTFRALYVLTMKRLGARDFYLFPDEYWDSLQENLGRNLVLVEAVHEGEVVAAILLMVGRSYIHYHLAATADKGRTMGASVFCNVSAALWAQKKGFLVEHMGGGPGGEESTLLAWKRGFDPNADFNPMHMGGVIHDDEVYAALSVGSKDMDFFPPWRAR